VKFVTHMPGLMRYPPSEFPPGSDRWQARMTCADFQRVARTADELGFDALTLSEHLALPVDLEPNMGAWWPHAFTAMAFLAGATTRIRVNASVIVLPYHHPVAFAKAVSTLDVMSGGRVMLTFGVGMAPGEFAALGVPFERRGAVTDEYVAVMKTLWRDERPEFHGEWVEFADVAFEPKPVQQPHPPLWFGGRSMASLDRAARLGGGWAPAGGLLGKGPWFEDPEQLPELLARVRETRAQVGIDDGPFDVHLPVVNPRIGPGHTQLPPAFVPESAQDIVDEIGRLAALGVTWTSVSRPKARERSLDEHLENLQWIAEEVVPACR
jgi:probable F420-dependent oxidoreductase